MTSPNPIRAAWARLATALRALLPVPALRPVPVPVRATPAPRRHHTAGAR